MKFHEAMQLMMFESASSVYLLIIRNKFHFYLQVWQFNQRWTRVSNPGEMIGVLFSPKILGILVHDVVRKFKGGAHLL